MARLGRRQPFKPIFGRLIAYSPAQSPVGRSLVVSRNAVQASLILHQRIFGPIKSTYAKYQPPSPQTVVNVLSDQSVQTARQRYGQCFPPIFQKRPIAGQPAPPRAYTVSRQSVEESSRLHHRPYHPLYNRLIQYAQPQAPIGKTILVSSVQDSARKHYRIFGPIFNRLIQYAQPAAPIGRSTVLSAISVREAQSRYANAFAPIFQTRPVAAQPVPPRSFFISAQSVSEAQRRFGRTGKATFGRPVREAGPPVASKPFVVSLTSTRESSRRWRQVYRPIFGIVHAPPPVPQPPVAQRCMVIKVAQNEAYRRYRTLTKPFTGRIRPRPQPFYAVTYTSRIRRHASYVQRIRRHAEYTQRVRRVATYENVV